MKISRQGIDLIIKWEGCKLTAYKDGGGVWTIGYGHTSAAGEPEVKTGLRITAQDAKDMFVRDIVRYEIAVRNALTRIPTQAQFDAMVSLCYNIGAGAFRGSSVVRKFNAGDVNGAGEAFRMWKKDNGKVVTGLVNRRADEARHFGLNIPTMGDSVPAQPVSPIPAPVAAKEDAKPPVAVPAPVRGGFWASVAALFRNSAA